LDTTNIAPGNVTAQVTLNDRDTGNSISQAGQFTVLYLRASVQELFIASSSALI
jgi:hypothetical protein